MDRYHGDECKEQCPGYVELSEGAFDCNGYGDCELNKSTNKWECDCDDYASGKGCEIVCPVSNNDAGDILVCSDHGTCNSALGTCSCLPGYYGEDCSLSCPGLLSATNDTATECSGHGSCLDIGATKVECECNAGFYGDACEQSCPGLVELSGVAYACSGHGTCDDGVCRCDPFFYGPACEQSCPGLVEIDGKQQECSGHGTCNAETLQCECSSPNYVGAACAINPPLSPRHLRELHVSPRPLFGFPDLHLRRGVSFPSFSPIQVPRRVLQRAVRVPEQLQRPRTLRRVGVSPLSSPATAPARVSGASPAPAATSRVPATPVAATASVWRRVDCKRGRNSSPGVCVCDEGFQGDHCEQTRRLPRKKTLTTLLALALLGAACGQLAAWRRQSVGTRGRCERRGSRASRRSCGGG